MRFFCIALMMIGIFATSQVAMALDSCCAGKESVSHIGTDTKKTMDDAHHCPMSAHHTMSLLPRDAMPDMHVSIPARSIWPDIATRDPFIAEGPIEPPAFA